MCTCFSFYQQFFPPTDDDPPDYYYHHHCVALKRNQMRMWQWRGVGLILSVHSWQVCDTLRSKKEDLLSRRVMLWSCVWSLMPLLCGSDFVLLICDFFRPACIQGWVCFRDVELSMFMHFFSIFYHPLRPFFLPSKDDPEHAFHQSFSLLCKLLHPFCTTNINISSNQIPILDDVERVRSMITIKVDCNNDDRNENDIRSLSLNRQRKSRLKERGRARPGLDMERRLFLLRWLVVASAWKFWLSKWVRLPLC